jgi:uncharacterized protein YjiS (DUF1127 family)
MYITERAFTVIRYGATGSVGLQLLWRPFRAALRFLAICHQRQRERAQLLALTDRELRDIGITRIEAIRAAEKSPWWR